MCNTMVHDGSIGDKSAGAREMILGSLPRIPREGAWRLAYPTMMRDEPMRAARRVRRGHESEREKGGGSSVLAVDPRAAVLETVVE